MTAETTVVERAPETREAGGPARIVVALAVIIPPALLVITIWQGWLFANPRNIAMFAAMYLVSGMGVTAGFHRLFTHTSFKTYPIIRVIFAVAGSTAVQGSILNWLADHRMHHAHSDKEGDPHSPHGHVHGRFWGFYHAHVGWLFADKKATYERWVPELMNDRALVAINRLFIPIVALGTFVVPAAAGFLLTGTVWGALEGILWGGLLRVCFLHHATFSVNSVCHLWGSRPYRTRDHSTNNPLIGLVSLGEGHHNTHHAFPSSARHGLKPYDFDPTWWCIWLMKKLRLVWDVKLPTPEQQMRLRARGIAE